MNDLSLLFYFAGVVANFGFLAIAACVISLLAFPATAIGIAMNAEYEDEDKTKFKWELWRKCLIGFIIFYCVMSFLPSERTLYMIAASEMGEEVINTDEFNKLRIILNDKLDEFIHEDDRNASDEE